MTRKECLEQAMGCVLKDRNNEYGEPENSFDLIADLWTAYTGHVFIGSDVAAMMALLKLARLKRNARHLDSAVDLAGYAACFAECASAETARPVPFAPKAEGVCRQNGNEQPEEPGFKRGDKVQAFNGEEWVDCRYIRWEEPEGRHVVQYKGCMCAIDPENLRPVSRAEGCETLVEKDAPQTPEEVCKRIIDANPATFHTPSYAEEQLEHHSRLQAHKPTGEELAEMAKEAGNG